MSRWVWFWLCAFLGLLTLVCGLLVPAHLRAVDDTVIEKAGRNTSDLVGKGIALANEKKLGAALLLAEAAQKEKIPGHGTVNGVANTVAQANPGLLAWGGEKPAGLALPLVSTNSEPFTECVIHFENREQTLEFLQASPNPDVQELLRYRTVTNTVVFSPSASAYGQALDTALAICGLLLADGRLSMGMSNSVFALASAANRGNPQPFEEMLKDFMSLGQRFNWGQLTSFVSRIDGPETLRLLANLARKTDAQMPALFAAVQLSGRPAAVAGYLMTFGNSGFNDLGASLRYGVGGVDELLRRNQQLYHSKFPVRLGRDLSLRTPQIALILKWVLYLTGGFLLAMAMHFARPPVSVLEQPLQVRGFHYAREILFALGFLLVVLLVSEPFLAQDSQRTEFRFQLRLPIGGGVVPAGKTGGSSSLMNQTVLLTMLLFFVLQALLYAASIVKLAEIRRQRVPSRIKLKLLENEDHLFDAGLYLGFLGTIISLVLVSLGVFKQPSLMAAYSSTSFGILFVVVFKILHLRPERRRLLLEAETDPVTAPPVPQSFPAPL